MSVETPPAPPVARACPRCGAALGPEQEWCLSCGTDVGARVAGTPRWRLPVAIVGGLLALAVIAVAVAIFQLADDEQQVAQAPPPQQQAAPARSAPPGEQPAPGEQGAQPGTTVPEASDDAVAPGNEAAPGGAATPEGDLEGTTPGDTGATTPGETPDHGDQGTGTTSPTDPGTTSPGGTGTSPGGEIGEWPAGRTAWTVILESSTSRSAAEKRAKELSAGGTQVGILDSDDYSSLRGGYFVVFSGQYDTRKQAEDALAGLSGKADDAYIRRVEPR